MSSSPVGVGAGALMFDPGEKIEVLRWSKCGWWWGRRVIGGSPGWFPSAFVQPVPSVTSGSSSAEAPEIEQEQPQGGGNVPAVGTCLASVTSPGGSYHRPQSAERSAQVDDAVWPPLPLGPMPLCLSRSEEVWPPLPPGPPPSAPDVSNATPPGKAQAHAAELQEAAVQTLGFTWDGRVAQTGPHDRDGRQLSRYFNYQEWAEAQGQRRAKSSGEEQGNAGRLMADGGRKRHRRC